MGNLLPTRRDAIRTATCFATGIGTAAFMYGRRKLSAATGADATVNILLGEKGARIKPALYGQFAEHIGGVIYDGIWVGPDSKIPNIDGIRRDTIEHVKRLGPVVVRWPGGCF